MKLIVDEMPYFSGECPFCDLSEHCKLTGDHCGPYDVPARERNVEECDGLITLEAYLNRRSHA